MTLTHNLPHIVTRFAPSPTGRLHVGHAWSALMAMDFAQQREGSFCLRIEDIDGVRSKEEHVAGIIEDLEWLGIRWDGPVVMQSERIALYEAALEQLRAMGLLYPCFCTRAEVASEVASSASAPHGPQGPLYPGTCRVLEEVERSRRLIHDPHCWRIDMGRAVALAGPLAWQEGEVATRIAQPETAGDAVLARKDAPVSYHLAATVDDADMGITDVIRGEDLRGATHVHRLLQALLGLPSPRYRFHGLLVDASGRRLAKRSAGLSIAELRAAGCDPAQLVAQLRAGVFPVGILLDQA
jgi:glutamyl-Q tRNA(Asp) synthetase